MDSRCLFMNKYILILGDILAIALITVIGFATHGEAGLSFLPRMGAIFLPLLVSWFLLAPALGLFREEIVRDVSQLWRAALAAFFAASLAAVLRGFLLNAPIIPIFAIVLAAVTAFGMILWRGIFFFLTRKMQKHSNLVL